MSNQLWLLTFALWLLHFELTSNPKPRGGLLLTSNHLWLLPFALCLLHFELTSNPKPRVGLLWTNFFKTMHYAQCTMHNALPTSHITHRTSHIPHPTFPSSCQPFHSPPKTRHSPLFNCPACGFFRILRNKSALETLIDVKTMETFLNRFVSCVSKCCTFAALK